LLNTKEKEFLKFEKLVASKVLNSIGAFLGYEKASFRGDAT